MSFFGNNGRKYYRTWKNSQDVVAKTAKKPATCDEILRGGTFAV